MTAQEAGSFLVLGGMIATILLVVGSAIDMQKTLRVFVNTMAVVDGFLVAALFFALAMLGPGVFGAALLFVLCGLVITLVIYTVVSQRKS